VANEPSPEPVGRRRRRVTVEVDRVAAGLVGVFVPRWRAHQAVVLPLDCFPAEVRPHLSKGVMLTASVNADAGRAEDLTFEDFRLVPPEGPD
jgi:hypothetical protein